MSMKQILSVFGIAMVGTLTVACSTPTTETATETETTEEVGSTASAYTKGASCTGCTSTSGGTINPNPAPTQTQTFTCDGSGGYTYLSGGSATGCGQEMTTGYQYTNTWDASGNLQTSIQKFGGGTGFSVSWIICPYWAPFLHCNAFGSCYCSAY